MCPHTTLQKEKYVLQKAVEAGIDAIQIQDTILMHEVHQER